MAFAKMAAVLAVGLTGGDVGAAAFAAENAARYNALGIVDILELSHLKIQRDSAQTDEERARIELLIEHSVLKTQERGARFVVNELSQDLPAPVLGLITPWNQMLQKQIDQRERVFQRQDPISSALEVAHMMTHWQTTIGPYIFQLPTTRGGALITLAPSMRAAKAGGSAVVKGAQSLGKKALAFAENRLASTSATLGETSQTTCLLADRINKAPYDPRAMESLLQTRYGKEAVTSSTLPSHNMPNVKLAGQAHPEKNVVFCHRGMPIFDDVARFDTRIPMEISAIRDARLHMRAATRNLRDEIQAGRVPSDLFTPNQLQDITSGKAKIEGLTWHHHQDRSRLQLILEEAHDINHVGGMHLWFSGQ